MGWLTLYHSPSPWGVLALIVFGFNLLFFIISYCTTSWGSVTLNGSHVTVGLWQGCLTHPTGEETCSPDILNEAGTKSGKSKLHPRCLYRTNINIG